MTLYRSKPSDIEAVQWTGENFEEVREFWREGVRMGPEGLELLAGKEGAQGWVPVPIGHWVVRQPGDLSDHWPVEPPYFAKKYDEVVKGSDQHEEYLGRMMDVIREGEELGIISAACDTHEGVTWTEAELHDRLTHGIDRCVPVFRVIAEPSAGGMRRPRRGAGS